MCCIQSEVRRRSVEAVLRPGSRMVWLRDGRGFHSKHRKKGDGCVCHARKTTTVFSSLALHNPPFFPRFSASSAGQLFSLFFITSFPFTNSAGRPRFQSRSRLMQSSLSIAKTTHTTYNAHTLIDTSLSAPYPANQKPPAALRPPVIRNGVLPLLLRRRRGRGAQCGKRLVVLLDVLQRQLIDRSDHIEDPE